MTLEELIVSTLLDNEVTIVERDIYTGDAPLYYTYHFDELGDSFGDDIAHLLRSLVQVHFFCPHGYESYKRRRLTRKRLVEAGFTWPATINASVSLDNKSAGEEKLEQHWVFECEYTTDVDGEI